MSEDHTAEREAFEAWYSAEDQETDDPERTYELTEEGMNELTKYCVWQGWQARAAAQAQQPWQYTPPAQERIDALELEVRQLTEQIAELRHAPTPQADSQPAPVREGEWINDAGRIKWLMWRVQDLEAKLAARAPADSVLEDAAQLERERICAAIKAEDDYCVEHGDYMLDSDDCIKIARSEWVRPDYLVDAARKQGANHD